jgi:hypothetical protein
MDSAVGFPAACCARSPWRPCDDQPPGSWPQATQLCHPNLGSPAGEDSKQSISYGALAPRRQLAGPVGSDVRPSVA